MKGTKKADPMRIEEFTVKILPMSERLVRFAACMLKEQEDARDLVQDVLLKLWEMGNQLEKIVNPEAFAMRMVRNRCLDRIKRGRLVPINRDAEAVLESWKSAEEYFPEVMDTDALVRKLMARLPGQQRTVIHLRDVEQLEFDEIAQITGMNVNALRVCLSRARKQVREELLTIWDYEERRGNNIT